ncbi:protein trichome birefringence-like 20 [Diospyros lotus]|uniref:protein trichome birefringence-like 20 n=1 Tax=Diospyros lotus TaxID=55363 RepID=UPI00224F94E1|nr:protein trichome birefringence-like 20 [Diospyros lotus]
MKLNLLQLLPSWKNWPGTGLVRVILILLITMVFLAIIPIYLHKISPFLLVFLMPRYDQEHKLALPAVDYSHRISAITGSKRTSLRRICNMFKGDWVPFPEGPYYTNETKCVIDNRQNCLKFGRPDSEFLKWRWKPDDCELPPFDGAQFLELVRGKSMAFVGDSVARNQMQSLICLLTSVTRPLDISYILETSEHWFYRDYNFTLAHLWTTHLVKAPGVKPQREVPSNLTLDEVDHSWAAEIETFDYVIISSGHWFLRPLNYFEKGSLVGCHSCSGDEKKKGFDMYYAYRKAFRTAFRTLLALPNFKGLTILRTITESHVGDRREWSEDGDCAMTRPLARGAMELGGDVLKLYVIQMEEFEAAEREGRKKGLKFRLLNITEPMLLRPDGHPNQYGHWPHERVRRADCLHWCLPGPVDLWNEILLQMVKMESQGS